MARTVETLEGHAVSIAADKQKIVKKWKVIGTNRAEIPDPENVSVAWPRKVGQRHSRFPRLVLESVDSEMDEKAVVVTETYATPTNELDERTDDYAQQWTWTHSSETEHVSSVPLIDDIVNVPASAVVGTTIDRDGDNVRGVDVKRHRGKIGVVKFVRRPELYEEIGAVNTLTGKLNDAPIWGCLTGELLYEGAQITLERRDPYYPELDCWRFEHSFEWRIQQPTQSFTLNEGLASESTEEVIVAPFDYLWFTTVKLTVEATVDDPATVMSVNESLHVATLYDSGDFELLGLAVP